MAYQGKHTGATIDAQIDRVVDGSVVTDNTLHEITSDDTKPVTGAAVEKGILAMTDSVVKRGSRNPVSGAAVFTAIDDAKAELRGRGYIYMGMADTTTVPDTSQGKVFYLASEKGEYTNFGGAEVTKESLSTLLWDGEAWSVELIADLVTPDEAKQIVLDNTASEVTTEGKNPVSGGAVAVAIDTKAEEKGYNLCARIDGDDTITFDDYDAEANDAVMKRLYADYMADKTVLSRRAVTIGCSPASPKVTQTRRLIVSEFTYNIMGIFEFLAEHADGDNRHRYIIQAWKKPSSSTWTMAVRSHTEMAFPILDDTGKIKDENLPLKTLVLDVKVIEGEGSEYGAIHYDFADDNAKNVGRQLLEISKDNVESANTLVFLRPLYELNSDSGMVPEARVLLDRKDIGHWMGVEFPMATIVGKESMQTDGEITDKLYIHVYHINIYERDGEILMTGSLSADVYRGIYSEDFEIEKKGYPVRTKEQSFTEEEQAQARKNIGAASTTEYYPEMAVGTADNLRGRGEATEEIFTYRPSAGASNSISEEGVATMKRIKGNTVVWNQKITNGTFTDNPNSDALPNGWENGVYYITLRATISYPSEGGIKFVFNKGEAATTKTLYAKLSSFSGIIAGHKYFISCDYYTNGISTTSKPDGCFALGGIVGDKYRVYLKNTNGVKSKFEVIKSFSVASDEFAIQSVFGYIEGAELWIYNLILIDLTKMFGAGNEPTTVEEFYERMPMSIDPYAYNEGELLSVNVESIVTNGFNQFNGEYAEVLPNNTYYLGGEYTSIGFAEELGGTTEEIVFPDDRLYTPATKGYIYASGANININLSHSGVRDGEYEPYEERVHDIPEIAQYFPEGMRSAGAVYDEITESEVIQRVGAVDLGSLEWYGGSSSDTGYRYFFAQINGLKLGFRKLTISADYDETEYAPNNELSKDKTIFVKVNYVGGNFPTAVVIRDDSYLNAAAFKSAMSGVMLYYELAEPIITPLPTRAINLNYPVWDWGTERAVSAKPSALFRADVVYGFNAVDTIRMNKSDIEALFKRVVALEAKVAESEAEATAESTDI